MKTKQISSSYLHTGTLAQPAVRTKALLYPAATGGLPAGRLWLATALTNPGWLSATSFQPPRAVGFTFKSVAGTAG